MIRGTVSVLWFLFLVLALTLTENIFSKSLIVNINLKFLTRNHLCSLTTIPNLIDKKYKVNHLKGFHGLGVSSQRENRQLSNFYADFTLPSMESCESVSLGRLASSNHHALDQVFDFEIATLISNTQILAITSTVLSSSGTLQETTKCLGNDQIDSVR